MIAKVINYNIESYETALEYLERVKDINKRFDLLIKYGQKFIAECPTKTQRVLNSFISQILSMKKSGNDPLIKYENLIKIFINHESLLADLLDFIIISDENCDSTILHRRIELHLDKLAEEKKSNAITKDSTIDLITSLIKSKKYQNKIDKNYILMLFKMHNFTDGIVTLSEIMDLRQELLTIYMDNHKYDKIINVCENFGRPVICINLGK